jgi:hypothetical protein
LGKALCDFMKNILLVLICLVLLSFGFKSLKRGGIPSAIKKEIKKFAKSSACGDAHVDEMKFNKNTVYVFNNGTCGNDMTTEVRDSKGKSKGMLGGFSGNTKIDGEDFSKAVFVKMIWKKNS